MCWSSWAPITQVTTVSGYWNATLRACEASTRSSPMWAGSVRSRPRTSGSSSRETHGGGPSRRRFTSAGFPPTSTARRGTPTRATRRFWPRPSWSSPRACASGDTWAGCSPRSASTGWRRPGADLEHCGRRRDRPPRPHPQHLCGQGRRRVRRTGQGCARKGQALLLRP